MNGAGLIPWGRLQKILAAFPRQRIVVFGDMVLDEFLYGRIDRVSREAPVLILEHQRLDRVPGGGANTVTNITALGGTALPVGLLGEDEAGGALRERLDGARIDASGLQREPTYATPTKTRILAGSPTSVRQQVVRIDRGLHGAVDGPTRERMMRSLRERVDGADALVVSDYGHGTLDDGARRSFRDLASRRGLITTVDSRRFLVSFRGMTAATPNLEEASRSLGYPVPDEDEAVAGAASHLRETLEAQSLVITRGSRGMTMVGADGEISHIPVFGTDQVADVTGAGDTVTAVLTLALAAGAATLEAAHLANVAAGLVVMKRGTATVTTAEMQQALEEGSRAR